MGTISPRSQQNLGTNTEREREKDMFWLNYLNKNPINKNIAINNSIIEAKTNSNRYQSQSSNNVFILPCPFLSTMHSRFKSRLKSG